MTAEVILIPAAEADIREAYDWYEQSRAGLGEEFLGCVDARIEAVRRLPESSEVVHQSFRRALVRRFPYAIFDEYIGGIVTIYGILHAARDPSKWRRRLP